MTRDKDRKRIIRRRMKTTGESYTTARRHVVARAAHAGARSSAAASAAPSRNPSIDHAAIAGMSDDKIERQTGHDWSDWLRLLDAEGADIMIHRDIARLVHDKYGVAGWWSQTVTVGYERLKGRRAIGQRMSGSYEASKSRTFDVPVSTLFKACADDKARTRWLDGVDATVRTATAPKTLRLQWPDGTIVAFWFTSKGPRKSAVALAHTKLASKAALDTAKTEWAARLDRLSRSLVREKA
jgi:hypothetical protein